MSALRKFWVYENKLVFVLSLTFGVVFLDRQALNFLAPFIIDDLQLSNTQIGMLVSGLSLTWALSGVVFGRLCDRIGHQKLILVTAIIIFSFSSIISGLAGGFMMLLAARLLMGLAEGPVLPISQMIVAVESSPERRGMNMGIMQQFGSNILGTFLAPLIMVGMATLWGWREAFFLAAVPGLVCAILVAVVMRPPQVKAVEDKFADLPQGEGSPLPIMEGLKFRNIWLCMVLSGLSIGWAILNFAFLPLYFTKMAGYSPATMSVLLSALGLSALVASILVPWLSDRYGRKPIILIFTLLSFAVPVGVMLFGNSLFTLIPFLLIGFMATGATPLLMATIPAETLPSTRVAGIMGIVMGVAEIFAALAGPLLGGLVADEFGLGGTLWLQIGFIAAILVLAALLIETAPRGNPPLATAGQPSHIH